MRLISQSNLVYTDVPYDQVSFILRRRFTLAMRGVWCMLGIAAHRTRRTWEHMIHTQRH